MLRLLVVPTLLLCLCCGYARAQPACAQLAAEAQASTSLRDSDPAAGLARAEAALQPARADPAACAAEQAMLLAAMGSNLHILGRIDDAIARYGEALALLPDTATPAQRATVHRGAGVARAEAEDYEGALQSYLTALGASREAGDMLEAAKTAGNIGNLYNTLGDYERSSSYHQQALAGFEEAGFREGVAGTLINLGALAARKAASAQARGDAEALRRESASQRDYNLRALELFTELGNERGIAYASANIGMALERLGELEQALDYHHRALELRSRIGDAYGEINSHATLASTLARMGRHDGAQRHLDAGRGMLPEGNVGLALELAQVQVELDEARGDLAAALHWQREVTRLRSEQASETHGMQVEQLQSRFELDQQAREIELLRRSAEVRDLQLDRQRMLLYAGLVIALLLAAMAAMLYSRLRMGHANARELERIARTDPLTGLPNRRAMAERIAEEIRRAQRSGKPFALLMADIDHFKAINDRYGHGCGDRVLVEVAQRLRSGLRAQDLLARWGGEEFLVLLPETDADGGTVLAEKLRARVYAVPVAVDGLHIAVSVTLGVTAFASGMDADSCVHAADEALYAGKRQGGNCVVAQAPADRQG